MKHKQPDTVTPPLNSDTVAPPQLNPDDYREELAEFDLTEEQENELLQTLWHIMSTFVDIGWGVDTVQMFLPDLFEKAGADSGNLIDSKNTKSFNQAANAGKGFKND